MSSLIEYLQYPFFIRALILGSMLSILLSWMSGYIVLRREVIFPHALANIGFLGIAVAILFNFSITIGLIFACIAGAILINAVEQKRLFTSDSTLEIFAQLGLSLSVVIISLFQGYQINIDQFLFGDILALSNNDLYVSGILFLIVGTVLLFCHKTFLRISLSDLLSQTTVKHKKIYHFLFIITFAITVAAVIKVVGILLVASFTTIPANIGKILGRSLKQSFILSVIFGIVSTIIGLFISAILNTPSGASIVLVLIFFWLLTVIFSKRFRL